MLKLKLHKQKKLQLATFAFTCDKAKFKKTITKTNGKVQFCERVASRY